VGTVTTQFFSRRYVEYAMHRVRLLKYYGIIPYIVFDGGPLPAKRGTESERRQRRDDNLARGHALAAQGKAAQAREYYCKAIDVTPQMAFQLIKVCHMRRVTFSFAYNCAQALRAEGIQYVVAPYEADAQLAFLEAQGIVQAILTEDSDLLVFGCQNVLFKLDATTHTVTSVSRSHFGKLDGSVNSGAISLLGWTDDQFRSMAILSGCDYLPSIPGVGLKTAYTWLRKWKTAAQVVRAVKLEGKKDVPKGYLRAFKMAERVFLHQRVYDPSAQALVCLSPLPSGEDFDQQTEAYIGE
jgi:exonuclease 1